MGGPGRVYGLHLGLLGLGGFLCGSGFGDLDVVGCGLRIEGLGFRV